VVDAANVLTPDDRPRLEKKLNAFERRNSIEIVVATVPSLDGFTPEDYANRLFRFWRLRNVLVLIAPKERINYVRTTSQFCRQLDNENLSEIANMIGEKSPHGDLGESTEAAVYRLLGLIKYGLGRLAAGHVFCQISPSARRSVR
jgi:uncharacterized protein (DUF1786 family)